MSSSGTTLFNSVPNQSGIATPSAVAIDGLGNVWVSNSGANSVSAFTSTGSSLSGMNGFTGTGLNAPDGIAITPR